MQFFYQRFNVQDYLLFTLLGITSIVLISNFIGQGAAENATNGISIVLSASVMFFSFLMTSKYGTKGNHGKAWILFMLFSAYWFCAETVEIIYPLVLGVEAWEYANDFFYITGYPLFFSFLVFYLRPFASQISKKMVIGISGLSLVLLIPSLMMIVDSEAFSTNENVLLLISYPILDSLVLIPALIGVVLFFKGEVNFMISLLCLGIITQIIGDNSVLYLSLQNIFYPGHLVEVLFLWTYALFAFGISNQLGIFKENVRKISI